MKLKVLFIFCLGVAEPQYPEYILALHSSKRLLIEQLNSSQHLLADAIINLTLAKGQRHEGRFHIKISNKNFRENSRNL